MSDLFEGTAAPSGDVVQPSSTITTPPADSPLVSMLVGEGKKYKTLDDLAKGYQNADEHIAQLVADNRALKEQVAQAKTVDDVLAKLEKPQASADQPQSAQGTPLDAAAVQELVKKAVTGIKTQEQKEANRKAAIAGLTALFGDKTQEVWNREAATPEQKDALTRLAEADPAKLVALFKPADKQMPVMQQSSVNSGAVNAPSDRSAIPGTKEYFDHLRKKEPKKYWAQETQLLRDTTIRTNPELYFGKK